MSTMTVNQSLLFKRLQQVQEIQIILMTDEEVIKFYEELVEHYGETLANFEHEPRRFQYQVTIYKYYKSKQND